VNGRRAAALPRHAPTEPRSVRAAELRARLRALPPRTLAELVGDRPVLVLAPHPDDESLGCGGLIALACAHRLPVQVAILTDGAASHPGAAAWPPARIAALRQQEARAAAAALGLPKERLAFLAAPDGQAPHEGPAFARLAAKLAGLAQACDVATICATWIGDPHPDHAAAAHLAAAVAARLGLRHLAYPVWTWAAPDAADLPTPPAAGARLNIAAVLPLKRRAIAAHASQTTPLIADPPIVSATLRAAAEQPWEGFLFERR
jgi:LmbE family N-acetylglucosaminyl deacetylase